VINKPTARGLQLLIDQIDFNSEDYYNLEFGSDDAPVDSTAGADAWTNLSGLTADLAKIRGELYRLGSGVENLRLPAIETIGLDKVAEQLRSLEFRMRPLGEILSRPEEESRLKRLIKDVLNVVDALDRVFELVDQQPGAMPAGTEAGLRSVYQLLLDTLSRYGLKQLEISDKFDPNLHRAMGTEANLKLSNGDISRVLLNGYLLNDDILRAAQVVVVKNDPDAGGAVSP
jgi:hypothetical protein